MRLFLMIAAATLERKRKKGLFITRHAKTSSNENSLQDDSF
jgi:hypothetical protein